VTDNYFIYIYEHSEMDYTNVNLASVEYAAAACDIHTVLLHLITCMCVEFMAVTQRNRWRWAFSFRLRLLHSGTTAYVTTTAHETG
jgi:hypothetical protein